MSEGNTFGKCLRRILKERDLAASEAARLVGFRSRNSLFRILSDETGWKVKASFLKKLRQVVGGQWPESCWRELEEALEIERVGPQQYSSNQAFMRVLNEQEPIRDYRVDHEGTSRSLASMLQDMLAESVRMEMIICGCCDDNLLRLLAQELGGAGDAGKVTIRHYIDVSESCAVDNILGVLPLLTQPWYNARLVAEGACSVQMLALYRVHMIHIFLTRPDGSAAWHQLLRYEPELFVCTSTRSEQYSIRDTLDRCRFDLELLKPKVQLSDGAAMYVDYIDNNRRLEENCVICSIKPDVSIACIPTDILRESIEAGFRDSGIADDAALAALMESLVQIHEQRVKNMFTKRRMTHLVFSVQAMELFMQRGVQTDHFFIQRAYTPAERRDIVRVLYEQMRDNPYFNIYFLRSDMPVPRNEITCYEGKGVLLLDAYTGYDLQMDHSEAVITQPLFMQRFKRFFMDDVLGRRVYSQKETMEILERLMQMETE